MSLVYLNNCAQHIRFRVEWSLLGAIGIHCAYYFTYIPYNYQ